jgi:hypothetical protein
MVLETLHGRGLQQEPTDSAEIARFLTKIDSKLADCLSNSISLDTRFDIAYEALLQCGLAALRAHGLRPDSRGGHHVMALQTLPTTIGFPKEKIRILDEFRKQRAAGLYDGSFNPSEAELHALVDTAVGLRQTLATWLKENKPDLLTKL